MNSYAKWIITNEFLNVFRFYLMQILRKNIEAFARVVQHDQTYITQIKVQDEISNEERARE